MGGCPSLELAMTGWGEATLVVNTGDVVLEARGELPAGQLAHGWYNLHGKPIGGHLKADRCKLIAPSGLAGRPGAETAWGGHRGGRGFARLDWLSAGTPV